MKVIVNNKSQDLQDYSNLLSLLERMKVDQRGIAVAVNNQVVSKNNWESFTLASNDKVTIIRATQGG